MSDIMGTKAITQIPGIVRLTWKINNIHHMFLPSAKNQAPLPKSIHEAEVLSG